MRRITTHGHTRGYGVTPTYRSWQNMVARCTQPSNPAYAHYQKRGIRLADCWRDFDRFLADMGERPKGTTLDRIDNDGNYEPGNCRWASRREQANNRVTNIRFDYRGRSLTLADLARETGISKEILRTRLCRSELPWTVELAVSIPGRLQRGEAERLFGGA